MPSETDVERPRDVSAIAERYFRAQALATALLIVFVEGVVLGTYLAISFLSAVVVGLSLIGVAWAPVFRTGGTFHLRTDDGPDAVVDALIGPVPPVLPLHWGMADEVDADGDAVTYRTSFLFGLRTTTVTVRTRTETAPDGTRRVKLELEMDGDPWATYTADVSGGDGRTDVDVEYASGRRFGLRRLPRALVTGRYREEALAAQGYTVVEQRREIGL
ncbi:hypothetical protein BRD14_02450 [Halobacteriales archaeon SW_5_68_122]|nr:MAG: hypothetical protein BRD14_02450 [Halobacteriales archaeon SW_5_68_122]